MEIPLQMDDLGVPPFKETPLRWKMVGAEKNRWEKKMSQWLAILSWGASWGGKLFVILLRGGTPENEKFGSCKYL